MITRNKAIQAFAQAFKNAESVWVNSAPIKDTIMASKAYQAAFENAIRLGLDAAYPFLVEEIMDSYGPKDAR